MCCYMTDLTLISVTALGRSENLALATIYSHNLGSIALLLDYTLIVGRYRPCDLMNDALILT